jgi:sialate O-acetylesterase
LLTAFSTAPQRGEAQVTLPAVLSSHMVIQRDRPIHLWGWASSGEQISVRLGKAESSTIADTNGRWSTYLPAMSAGGPYEINISGKNSIALSDVLVGDVWVASGQSNMELPLKGFPRSPLNRSAEEIAAANYPKLRLFQVGRKTSTHPDFDVTAQQPWTACTPKVAANFSALAYFFGRDLQKDIKVPIGLISSNWGATPAEAWMSLRGFGRDEMLMPYFSDALAELTAKESIAAEQQRFIAIRDKSDSNATADPTAMNKSYKPEAYPSALYNGMIAPLTPLPIKGVIWYQGESDAFPAQSPLYRRLFPALIEDWRLAWHEPELPFLYVQLANYDAPTIRDWAEIRDAQRATLKLADTAMIVTIDIGSSKNIHPPDKQTVGARLARAARAGAYHEPLEYSGPLFRQAVIDGDSIRLYFDHAKDGLQLKESAPSGFEIAGADRKFVSADAHIDGDAVVLAVAKGKPPIYVRYLWKNDPQAQLFGKDGLPASPFQGEIVGAIR